MEIKRDLYLDRIKVRRHNGLIKVITGIRRCGKSYLLNNIFYNFLINNGIHENHIIQIAFDIRSHREWRD
ncbi:MAG: AAA family ATPase, partial [Verrucomicrobia bacterium]|nr:AAA family ATPase [Verrucomicrobiota bacterium]